MAGAPLTCTQPMHGKWAHGWRNYRRGKNVTPQTQNGLKHEKNIPRLPVDFSFLANQTIGNLYFPFFFTR